MKRQNKALVPLKPPTVEMLRPDEIAAQLPRTQAELLKMLVQQGVAEALAARDEFAFEPWFRTRQVAYEIKRLQTVPERKKWALFYERHGCLACRTQERPHASNGFCNTCQQRVFRQLKDIVAELIEEPSGRA